MRNLAESKQYRGHTINVFYDENATAPNEWENDDLFIVYDHRDFEVKVKGFEPREIYEHITQTKRNFYKGYHVFTVNAYIHSGVALSLGREYPFNCQWDVSTTGYVLVKRQKEWSYTKEKARKLAGMLLEEWNTYLNGGVLAYTVEKEGLVIDSCGGFYDSIENVMKEGVNVVNEEVNRALKSHVEKVKVWIKNKVPFMNRKQFEYSL